MVLISPYNPFYYRQSPIASPSRFAKVQRQWQASTNVNIIPCPSNPPLYKFCKASLKSLVFRWISRSTRCVHGALLNPSYTSPTLLPTNLLILYLLLSIQPPPLRLQWGYFNALSLTPCFFFVFREISIIFRTWPKWKRLPCMRSVWPFPTLQPWSLEVS